MPGESVKLPSSQIKDVITHLLAVLNLSGFNKTSPETLRKAKFDKTEAIEPLLRLAAELLYFHQYHDLRQITGDQSCDIDFKSDPATYILEQCNRILYHAGIHHSDIDEKNNAISSRKLLLLIGWLMCSKNVLSDIIHYNTTCLSTILDENFHLHNKTAGDNLSKGNLIPLSYQDVNWDQRAKQVAWLMGKYRLSSKNLYWKYQEMVNLFHKIHTSTSGVSLSSRNSHLVMAEASLLRYPQALEKYCIILNKENQRLHAYIKWQEKEDIFWQWMESVVDAEVSSEQYKKNQNNMLIPCEISVDASVERCDELEGLLYQLDQERLVKKKRTAQTNQHQSGESGSQSFKREEEDLIRILGARERLQSNQTPGLLKILTKMPRLHLRTEKPKKHQDGDKCLIKTEILHLTEAVRDLERELEQIRTLSSCNCNKVLLKKQELVSIPPLSMKER